MQNVRLDESKAEIKSQENTNNLRYADDTTLIAASKERKERKEKGKKRKRRVYANVFHEFGCKNLKENINKSNPEMHF